MPLVYEAEGLEPGMARLKRLLVVGCVLSVSGVCAQAALATTINIPAGYEAEISSTLLGGCDANSYGYQIGTMGAQVPLGSKPFDCSNPIPEPDVTAGPVSSAQTFRLFLTDGTCNETYFSDGTPVDHALVTTNADGSLSVALNDGGPGCPVATSNSPPAPGGGNFTATVTIVAAPPTVTVTAPAPPAGQSGYFNIANLATDGGHIPVSVAASDGTGSGMNAIDCTDNNSPVSVINQAGRGTARMTGTVDVSGNGQHAIACTASSNASAPGNTGGANHGTVNIDSTAPALAIRSSPLIVGATALDGALVSSYPLSTSDPDDQPSVSCTPSTPAHFPIGDSGVTCRATDQAGNSSKLQFAVRVRPPPPASASFGSVTMAGPTAQVTVVCHGVAGQSCRGTLVATSRETPRGRAPRGAKAPTSQRTHGSAIIGQSVFSVGAGDKTKVTIRLNVSARRLLSRAYRLPATLALPGGAIRATTFRYARVAVPIFFTALFKRSFTTLSALTAGALPTGATVSVRCRRGPPCAHSFRAKRRTLDMTRIVADKRFPPGSQVIVTVAAVDRIGQVSVITMKAGQQPAYTILCLSPGTRTPARCHT